jgi:hypothetical protein
MVGRSTQGPTRWLRGMIAAVALVAACGGDAPTSTEASVVGTYTLRTANGAAVPALLEEQPVRLEVLAGTLTLAADRTFTNEQQIRSTENGVATTRAINLAGTYTVRGTTLTLVDPDDGTATATLGDDTITIGNGSVTFVYRR